MQSSPIYSRVGRLALRARPRATARARVDEKERGHPFSWFFSMEYCIIYSLSSIWRNIKQYIRKRIQWFLTTHFLLQAHHLREVVMLARENRSTLNHRDSEIIRDKNMSADNIVGLVNVWIEPTFPLTEYLHYYYYCYQTLLLILLLVESSRTNRLMTTHPALLSSSQFIKGIIRAEALLARFEVCSRFSA